MILAVLQARTSSTRLPGKVMLPVAGAPMLARQIERLLRARRIDRLVIATSERSEDDCVADLARGAGADCFRGSLEDVLDRFYRAAENYMPKHVVRVTGDCPLADWEIIDACVDFTVAGSFDYGSNTLNPTWPDGLDVEVFTFGALRAAWREGKLLIEREHVTPFINRRPQRFRLGSFENATDLSALRWTVDEPLDYEFVCRVYDALYPTNPAFTTADVLCLLGAHPELAALNADLERNAKFRQAAEALTKESHDAN